MIGVRALFVIFRVELITPCKLVVQVVPQSNSELEACCPFGCEPCNDTHAGSREEESGREEGPSKAEKERGGKEEEDPKAFLGSLEIGSLYTPNVALLHSLTFG